MEKENLKPPIDPLETEHRDPLEVALMEQMLGKNSSTDEQVAWIEQYGARVSNLIDHYKHDEIRNLARTGNYEEAARLLKEILETEEGNDE